MKVASKKAEYTNGGYDGKYKGYVIRINPTLYGNYRVRVHSEEGVFFLSTFSDSLKGAHKVAEDTIDESGAKS